jgi:hypothetical protein
MALRLSSQGLNGYWSIFRDWMTIVLVIWLSNIIWILVDNINWILDDWCACLSYRLKRSLVLPKCYISNSILYDDYLFWYVPYEIYKIWWDLIMVTQVKSSRWEISFCGRNSPSQLYHNQLDYLKSWVTWFVHKCMLRFMFWFRIQSPLGLMIPIYPKLVLICQLSV